MKISREAWGEEQHFESDWWSDCRNTFGEEAKQLTYARKMGLGPINDGGRWPLYDLPGFRVLDIGGGPVSMVLKCRGLDRAVVVDPCDYPSWTRDRYESVGVELVKMPAEDYVPDQIFDEVWCYNVLQHTHQPELIVAMMRGAASLVRIFEWVEMPPSPGHPHEFSSAQLADWLDAERDPRSWTRESEITWDLNVGRPIWGGKAFHGYVYTGI